MSAFLVASAARASENTAQQAAAAVNRLSELETKIEGFFDRAKIPTQEKNFSLHGELSGTINGSLVEHSPLSMAILGVIAGGVLGGVTGGALGVPLLSDPGLILPGVLAGGTAGATGAPFIPTGRGSIAGSVSGHVEGEGYQIDESASLFKFMVLDPSVLQGLRETVSANPKVDFSGCATTVISALEQIEKDPHTISPDEAETLVNDLREFRKQIRVLKAAKKDAFNADSLSSRIGRYLNDYEGWAKDKRVSLETAAVFKPVFDIQRATYVALATKFPQGFGEGVGEYSGAEIHQTLGFPEETAKAAILRVMGSSKEDPGLNPKEDYWLWIKRPDYTESDLRADFRLVGLYRELKVFQGSRVNVVVPTVGSSDSYLREKDGIHSGEITPAAPNPDFPLICRDNTAKSAARFLIQISRSNDPFYVTNPPSNLNLRAHFYQQK